MPLQMPVPDGSPLGSGHTPVLGRQLSIPYVAPAVCGNRRFVRTKGELQKHRSRSQKALWEVLRGSECRFYRYEPSDRRCGRRRGSPKGSRSQPFLSAFMHEKSHKSGFCRLVYNINLEYLEWIWGIFTLLE
jgi:hypothetical protein